MTAEIAVFNKSAVSLAADSAVTISGGDGVNKIYTGADKLFALSKHHPIGIMIFGSADLCGIPWEMIIKEFRKQLGSNSFDTVEEYSEKFWEYLCLGEYIIPQDIRENYLVDTYSNRFFPSLINHIEEKRIKPIIDENNEKPSITETYRILEEEANVILNGLKQQPFYEGFSEADITDAVAFSLPIAKKTCEERLFQEEGQEIPDSLVQVIADLFSRVTCQQSPFGRNTGLVFAGYGNNEFMPAVLAFNVLGFFKSKLRFSPNLDKSSSGGLCGVKAYAQEEEVETFLNGISNNIKGFMYAGFEVESNTISKKIKDKINALALSESDKETLCNELDELLNDRCNGYQAVVDQHIIENYTSKVTEMIEFLPKQDLAYMAESLVNLTAFKRKVSNDNETVGGAIDVAIISKGDGFIWVKRKHYFDKNLNHHYFTKTA
ncbi:TPA: hypothetical protein VGT10_000112 [Enterobacter cloacae]|nr:hypothetical protein [Enterobacter cloacae]